MHTAPTHSCTAPHPPHRSSQTSSQHGEAGSDRQRGNNAQRRRDRGRGAARLALAAAARPTTTHTHTPTSRAQCGARPYSARLDPCPLRGSPSSPTRRAAPGSGSQAAPVPAPTPNVSAAPPAPTRITPPAPPTSPRSAGVVPTTPPRAGPTTPPRAPSHGAGAFAVLHGGVGPNCNGSSRRGTDAGGAAAESWDVGL
jgi:hypothetical protein